MTGRIARPIASLLLVISMASPAPSFAGVSFSITIAPPPLPVYVQPIIPGPDYIWSPGYWAYSYDDDDYYWVPGTWVRAPEVGLLWTPGYWGWHEGVYLWNAGYWGPHVGYYGGINYGCGYGGSGYWGGHWDHGSFYYNTAVTHVNTTIIHNTYNQTIINNTTIQRVSFNGGNGGTTAQPTAQELAAAHERHVAPTSLQTQHEHAAGTNHSLFASVNHGAPPVAATAKAGVFSGHGVIAAKAVKTPSLSSKSPPSGGSPIKSAGTNDHKPLNGQNTAFDKAKQITHGPVPSNSVSANGHKAHQVAAAGPNQFKPAAVHRPPPVQHASHQPPPHPQPPHIQHASHQPHPKPKGQDRKGNG